MKLSYFPETDSLYIVLDLDAAGVPVGIDIEHASQVLDLSRVDTTNLPFRTG